MRVRDLCSSPAISEPVSGIAWKMNQSDVSSVIVIDAARHPVGIVTVRDLAVRVVGQGRQPTTPVNDLMTRSPAVISMDADVGEALTLMRQNAGRTLPVVDDRGVLQGVIAFDDILLQELSRSAIAHGVLVEQLKVEHQSVAV